MNHSVDAALNSTLPTLGDSVVVAGFDPPPLRSVLAIIVAVISFGALAVMWNFRIFWPTEPTDQAYWILKFVVPPAVSVVLCLQIFLIMSRQVTLSATHVTLKRYGSVLWSVEIAALDECRIAASSRRRITLQTLTGQQFRLAPIRGEEFWPFASEIQARALEFVMTRVWLSLEREKAASFGPFTVSWDGISCGDKSIAWQDVAEIRIDSMYVSVIAVDNRKAWVSRRIHRVPNILALLSVHAHCRATWESVRRMVRDGQPVSHRLSDILSSVDSLRPYVTADPTSVDAMIFEMMKRDFALAAVQDVSDTNAFVDTLATIRPEVVDEIINQMGTGRARVKVESIAYRRLLSRVQFALQDNALSEKSTSNSPPSDQS